MGNQENKELRDRLAEKMGWVFDECGSCMAHATTGKQFVDRHRDHPVPDTLDGAAACMPEGWEWRRHTVAGGHGEWMATRYGDYGIVEHRLRIPDTGDEKCDRFLLALKCWEAR